MSEFCSILRFGGHFIFLQPFCFLKKSKFGQTVHTNFHAKSGLYSSRNEQVMLNFVIWQPFCFSKFCQNLFRLSIRTSMQNLESVAQKLSELWHLVRKRTNTYIQVIIQSKLHFSYSRRKNPNKWIFAPAMSTLYLFLCDTYNRTETLVYIFKGCVYLPIPYRSLNAYLPILYRSLNAYLPILYRSVKAYLPIPYIFLKVLKMVQNMKNVKYFFSKKNCISHCCCWWVILLVLILLNNTLSFDIKYRY